MAAANGLRALLQRERPAAGRLLDVACGTGRHLAELRQWYEVEGVDINPDLLATAAARLPAVPLHLQDMVTMSLGTRFDVITCLFSSIAYVRTFENLCSTMAAFARHLDVGGLVVLEPYFTPTQYWIDRVTLNVVDEPQLKITWMYNSPPPVNNIATIDIHHSIGTPERVESFVERHELGLFTQAQHIDAFARAGFSAEFDQQGFFGRGAYTATLQA